MSGAADPSLRRTCDVAVLGLGIMGVSALYHLSRRGVQVLGIEANGPLHSFGSSHGRSRIFRRAYWEGEQYVDLLDHSYAGWRELDDALPETIAVQSGGLFIGPADSTLVRGSHQTALRCDIKHEYLDHAEIRDRFPAFHVDQGAAAVYEPEAMKLDADRARLGFVSRAVAAGAQAAYGQTVRSVTQGPGGTVSVAGDGWQVNCGTVVIALGAWIGRFLPGEIGPHITPMRIPVYTFGVHESRRHEHRAEQFPVFLAENPDGALLYGLAESDSPGAALKIGFHNRQLTPVDVDAERRPPTNAERAELWSAVKNLLPGARNVGRSTSCVYTVSSDGSFLFGRSRELDGVVYVSACSGHGFKFAPGIGEALAQLVIDGRSAFDISMFDAARMRQAVPTSVGGQHDRSA